MEYLAAHAGYTRVHNPITGEKDLVRLPGLVAIAYQHETSRAGDPHLHTHVLVPNRQARADGRLVSVDGTSLYHEARAAGVIYQATLRHELHRLLGVEWAPVDPRTGMAEVAGVDPATITAWSQRSTQLRAVGGRQSRRRRPAEGAVAGAAGGRAKGHPTGQTRAAVVGRTAAAVARGCAWTPAHREARQREPGRRGGRRRGHRLIGTGSRRRPGSTRRRSPAPTWSRSSAPSCPSTPNAHPRELVEAAVDEIGMRLTGPRVAHQREGHERFTLDRILAEEAVLLTWSTPATAGAAVGPRRHRGAVAGPAARRAQHRHHAVAGAPVGAPAGAGKTTSMRALAAVAHRSPPAAWWCSRPTGKAVDVAVREGAGDTGYTIAKP